MSEVEKSDVHHAMNVVCAAIREDEGYRISWQANIAMAFKDSMEQEGTHSPNPGNHSILVTRAMLHKIANDAADTFLNNLTRL